MDKINLNRTSRQDVDILLIEAETMGTQPNACFDGLSDISWSVVRVNQLNNALSVLATQSPRLVLLALEQLQAHESEFAASLKKYMPALVLFGCVEQKIAHWAKKYQALDFIEYPFGTERLVMTIHNALRHQTLIELENTYQQGVSRDHYHDFIGASIAMQTIYRIIDQVATSKAPVFITGESGTGKELCAQAIHAESRRKEQPFIAINCAAIPENLLESEIFGHVKGAFTGAHQNRQGAASQAHKGTLFLDEIADMPLDSQRKLLRFIQTGQFQKIGNSQVETVDVRFICATNHDIDKDVHEGKFREDLYYRLNVVPIRLPALHKRDNDILMISQYFLEQYSRQEQKSFIGFNPETAYLLHQYHWPGNVRQLQNVIHNTVVLNDGRYMTPDMLPEPLNQLPGSDNINLADNHFSEILDSRPESHYPVSQQIRPLWQMEKECIETALKACDGDISRAAIFLEIDASTIYRKLRQWKAGKQKQHKRKKIASKVTG